MVLVEEFCIKRQGLHKKIAHALVGGVFGQQAVTAENAAGIGVGHERGMPQGIEKDAIRGFRPDAAHRQQLPPKLLARPGPHEVQGGVAGRGIPAGKGTHVVQKIAQPFRLEPEKTRRPQGLLQNFRGKGPQGRGP